MFICPSSTYRVHSVVHRLHSTCVLMVRRQSGFAMLVPRSTGSGSTEVWYVPGSKWDHAEDIFRSQKWGAFQNSHLENGSCHPHTLLGPCHSKTLGIHLWSWLRMYTDPGSISPQFLVPSPYLLASLTHHMIQLCYFASQNYWVAVHVQNFDEYFWRLWIKETHKILSQAFGM